MYHEEEVEFEEEDEEGEEAEARCNSHASVFRSLDSEFEEAEAHEDVEVEASRFGAHRADSEATSGRASSEGKLVLEHRNEESNFCW